MSLATMDAGRPGEPKPAGVAVQEIDDHFGARGIVGRGVALLDRDVEQRRVARARDDAATDPIRVRQHDLAVQDGPAEQQRRGNGRVERLPNARQSSARPRHRSSGSASPPKLRPGSRQSPRAPAEGRTCGSRTVLPRLGRWNVRMSRKNRSQSAIGRSPTRRVIDSEEVSMGWITPPV